MPCKIIDRMIRFIIAYILVIASGFAQAQVGTITVGKQTLDNNTVRAIQTVQPGFGLYGDSATVATNVLKFYTQNKYLAQNASAQKLDTAKALHDRIALAQEVLKERILAEEYESVMLTTIAVSESEALQYYNKHLSQYTTPGYRNSFFVQTADSSASVMKEIRAVVDKQSKGSKADIKIANDTYYITFSNFYTDNKHFPYLNQILSAKQNTWVGPLTLPGTNGFLYYYVMDGVPEKVTPFEQVKDNCMQAARNEKVAQLQKEWETKAQQQYPVTIKPANNTTNTK